MNEVQLNIFKISYQWVEDDHDEILLTKAVNKLEFEKDLLVAKKFAENLIEKKQTMQII